MKVINRSILVMLTFGIAIVILLSISYYFFILKTVVRKERENITTISKEVADHAESHIYEKILVAKSIAVSSQIVEELALSNSYYDSLDEKDRNKEIDDLNNRWLNTDSLTDPFIKKYMQNSVSDFLNNQIEINPDNFGEIFMTNKYGVLVSTTNKLTTLSHSSKYWWKAAYNNGEGDIFLDDRGYDNSVDGYVLGVTVPVLDGREVLGILKCNINISGPLTDLVSVYNKRNISRILIVRSGGLVISDGKSLPLKSRVCNSVIDSIKEKDTMSLIVKEDGNSKIYAHSPIETYLGNTMVLLGGNPESIDHSSGNYGNEQWHVVIELDMKKLILSSRYVLYTIFLIFIVALIFTIITATVFGWWQTRPILKLVSNVDSFAKVEAEAEDEIKVIENYINNMNSKVQSMMEYKEKLLSQLDSHKKLEAKFRKISRIDDLTHIYNRRAFNSHLNLNISRAKRHKEELSILMIDIDKYKEVNDVYGHDIGDSVLQNFVKILEESVREEDVIARLGGDEFVIILPHTNGCTAEMLANRIRNNIKNFNFQKVGKITISAGVSELKSDDTPNTFIKRADNSLYQAKENGRNSVCFLFKN